VLLGLASNVIVGIPAIIKGDMILTAICVTIFIFTINGYLLYSKTKHVDFGIHSMLGIYFVCFSYAITTHLIFNPLILVFPIIIALSGVLFTDRGPKLFYTFICIAGAIFYIIEMNRRIQYIEQDYELFIACVIATGMLFGLYYVSYLHETTIQNFQDELASKEKHLRVKNRELEKYIDSNLQLENFAYLASHELKTPMRNITNFAGLLTMKLKSKVDPADEELILYIKNEVVRMNSLIADLLQLSQMSNERPTIENIISENFAEYRPYIEIKSLPSQVQGNIELMMHLIHNLIENAIKFNRVGFPPQIQIKGYTDGQYHHFEIHDSGIGIPDTYKEQIFLIFKRLHNQSDIKGNGIGLSLCRKIVERHGGKIWIEDGVPHGAVFHFTILG